MNFGDLSINLSGECNELVNVVLWNLAIEINTDDFENGLNMKIQTNKQFQTPYKIILDTADNEWLVFSTNGAVSHQVQVGKCISQLEILAISHSQQMNLHLKTN